MDVRTRVRCAYPGYGGPYKHHVLEQPLQR